MSRFISKFAVAILILALGAGAFAQRGGDETKSEDTGGKNLAAQLAKPDPKAPIPMDDLDYRRFLELMPEEEFAAARKAMGKQGKKPPFEFPELTYPAGDENPTSYRFDMGPAGAPVKAGYVAVTKDDLFSWEKGYGWSLKPAAGDFLYNGPADLPLQKIYEYALVQRGAVEKSYTDRGKEFDTSIKTTFQDKTLDFYAEFLDDLSRDAVLNPKELAFKVSLPNGRYTVSLILGDLQIPRYGMDVFANGDLVASNLFPTKVQWRGSMAPGSPWPMRITFPTRVVRNTLRIGLRANDNIFMERAEVGAETPDFNYSMLPYVMGLRPAIKPSPFFGKRMNFHGPATQMSIAGLTISPYQAPPLELIRQRLSAGPGVEDANALAGIEAFNAVTDKINEVDFNKTPGPNGPLAKAEKCFSAIPDSEALLKATAFLALAGHLETPLREEQRWASIAIDVLEKALKTKPDDIELDRLLTTAKHLKDAAYRIEHAAELGVSQGRTEAACLLNWIGEESVLYDKALMRYGRCFANIDAHRWTQTWHIAEETFCKLEQRVPGNRFSNYFLEWDATGWEVPDYSSDTEGAPRWAILCREAFNRLVDQADWWANNRQLPDGRLGGGWGDDVEINVVWQMVMLINPDASPGAMEAVRALTEGVWWSGEVDRDLGFFDGIADVEHTAEWTGDSQALIQGIDYGNPIYYERSLLTAKLMRDLWTGITPMGHRHFKSMVLGNKKIGDTYGWGVQDARIDHPLCGRALLPAFWAWWYSPTDELHGLMSEWAEAWWADSKRTQNGKPEWAIPGPIGFHTDTIGGNDATVWRQGSPKTNTYENPKYVEFILNLFSRMYARTGDPKWLLPKACKVTFTDVSETEFTAVRDPDVSTKVEDKNAVFDKIDLEYVLEIVKKTWPSTTSEIASTDRIALPGLNQMVNLLTGGGALMGLDFVPVTFNKTSRHVAFMNLASSRKGATTLLYNFNPKPETVNMNLWTLEVGAEHEVVVGIDENDDDVIDKTVKTFTYVLEHRGDSISFEIPSRKSMIVTVTQTKPPKDMPKRIVDLALAPVDIQYEDGKLSVTVHNIGNEDCGPFTAKVQQRAQGKDKLIATLEFDGLEAPNDLEPRRAVKTIDWKLPAEATLDKPVSIVVQLDPDDKYYEITERNNVIGQAFPHEQKAYMVPRIWRSWAEELGIAPFIPFPDDFPKDQIR